MTRPAKDGNGLRELSLADIRLVSQALLGMVSVGEKVTYECMDQTPPDDSDALTMFYSDGPGHSGKAMDAFLLMQYANLSGFDHVRALVVLTSTVVDSVDGCFSSDAEAGSV